MNTLNELENSTQPVEEQNDQPESTVEDVSTDQQEEQQKTASDSFREMNQKFKRQEEENERLRQESQYYRQQAEQKEQAANETYNLDTLPDDDIPSVGHIKHSQKMTQSELKSIKERLIVSDLRDRHSDFNTVVNSDTMRKLGQEDPLLAKMILANTNREEQLEMSYSAIKRYGIYKKPEAQGEENRVQENSMKPRPVNAVTSSKKSALSQASAWGNHAPSNEDRMQQYRYAMAKAKELNY